MDFGIVILAIIQGIAEFLPISSSAHLILFRDLFGIGSSITADMELIFDIALHLGTLLAIFIFFFKDFWKMIVSFFTKGTKEKEGRLCLYLIIATIPAALAGVFLEDIIDGMIRSNFILIACALIFMGIVIFLVDSKSKQSREVEDLTWRDALLIGCAQVFALIPGFSRSGTTISMARYLKLKREDAAKFSFYLSAPVVGGAVVLSLLKSESRALIAANAATFIIGIFVSFLVGLFCIGFLLKYLRKHDFCLFMWYRVLLGILVIGICVFA